MHQISDRVRADLFDWLSSGPMYWAGDLEEDAFLSKLFDLTKLPSTDWRRSLYPTAAEDIRQHRVYNSDWSDDWVFTDARFNLRHADDQLVLRFLLETVNARTRSNASAAAELAKVYSEALRPSGFAIEPGRKIDATIFYETRRTSGVNSPRNMLVTPADVRDSAVLSEHLARLERDIDTDPPAAIAHCKELLESQFKLILAAFGEPINERDDLPKLYTDVARVLGIHAGSVPGNVRASTAVRNMFGSLQTLVRTISEARNSMGTGHGRETESSAQPRHARLVFNATVAVAEFVAATWAMMDMVSGAREGDALWN